MAVLIIVELLRVKDPEDLTRYGQGIIPQMQARGARTLARGFDVVEGSPQGSMRVVIEFPSAAGFRSWQESAEYQELKRLRLRSADVNIIVVEAV
jgi:uncharacterized protein (DUF1330 family)